MAAVADPIHVEPASEAGRLLDADAQAALLLEKDGIRYRLERLDGSAPADPVRRQRGRFAPERALNLIGLGAAQEESDIARLKDQYVAEAAAHRNG